MYYRANAERLELKDVYADSVPRAAVDNARRDVAREIFSEVDVLLGRNTEKINFTNGTFKLCFNRKLEVDIADLEKKYKEKP